MPMSSLPDGWESDYDGSRWFFRYKPTGLVQYHFPQAGDEYSEYYGSFGDAAPDLAPEELLESERQLKRRSTTGERRSGRKQGPSREPVVEEEEEEPDDGGGGGGGGLFSFESFAYLGPGSYNDVSPLGDEDDGRPSDVPARGGAGSAMLTPAGETPGAQSLSPMTSAGATPNVVSSEPVLAVDTGYVTATGGYLQQQQQQQQQPMSPGVPMLDSTERPFELPDASNMGASNSHALARTDQAYSPVGFMAELPSELTAQCLEESNPPPIELPGNEIVFGGVQMGGSMIQSGPVELPHEPIEVSRIANMPGVAAQQATAEGAKMIQSTEAVQGAIAQGQGQHESSIRRKPTVTGAPLYRPFRATQIIAEEEVPGRPSSVLGSMSVAGSENNELGKFNKRHSMAGAMPPPNIDRASAPLALQPPNRPPKEPLGDHAAEALRPGPKEPDPRLPGTGTRDRSISTPAVPAHAIQGAQDGLRHVPSVLRPPQGPNVASQDALAPTTKVLAHVPSILKPGRGQAPAVPIQAGQAAQDQRFRMPPKAYMAFATGQHGPELSALGMSRESAQPEPSQSRPNLLRHTTLPEQMTSQTKPLEGIVEPSAVPAPLSLGKKRPGAPSSVPMSANFASASLPPAEAARREARAEAEKKEQQRSDSSEAAPMVVSIEAGAEAASARSPPAQAQEAFPPLETRPPRMQHSDSIVSDVSAPTPGSMSSGRLNSIQTPSPLQTPDASHRPSVVSLNSYQSDVAAARANVAPVGAYSQTRTHHSDSIVSDVSAPTPGSATSSRLNSLADPSPLQTPDVSEQPPAIETGSAQNALPKTTSPPTSFGIIASEIVPPPAQATLAPPEPAHPQTSTSQGGGSVSSLGRSLSVVSAMSSNGPSRSQESEQVSPVPSTVTPLQGPSSPQRVPSSESAEQEQEQAPRKAEPLGIVVEHSVVVEAETVTAPAMTGGNVAIEASSEVVGVSTEPLDGQAQAERPQDSAATASGPTQTQPATPNSPSQTPPPLEQRASLSQPPSFSVQGQDSFTPSQHPTYSYSQAPEQTATPAPGQAASPPPQGQTMRTQTQLSTDGASQGFQPPGTPTPNQVHPPPPQQQPTPVQQGQPFVYGPPQDPHHPDQIQSPPPQQQPTALQSQQSAYGAPQRDQSGTPVPLRMHTVPSQSPPAVPPTMPPHPPPGAGPAVPPPSHHGGQAGYPVPMHPQGQGQVAFPTQQPHMRPLSPSVPVQGSASVINPSTAQVGPSLAPPAGSPRPVQPGYPGSPPNAPMNPQTPAGALQRPPQSQFVPQPQGQAPNQSMPPQIPQGRMAATPQAQQPFPAPQGAPRPATMPPQQPSILTQIAGRPAAQAVMPGTPQASGPLAPPQTLGQPMGQPGNAPQMGGRPAQASNLAAVQNPVVAPGGMVMPPSFQNSPNLVSRPGGVVSPPPQQGQLQVGLQGPGSMPPPVQPLQQQLQPQIYGQQHPQQQQMRPTQGTPTIGPLPIQSPAVPPQATRPPVMGGQQPLQQQYFPNQGPCAQGSSPPVLPMQPPKPITQQMPIRPGPVQQHAQQAPQGPMYGHAGPQPGHPGPVQQPQLSTQQAGPQIGRQGFPQPQMGPPPNPHQTIQGQQQPQTPGGQQVAAQRMPVQGQQQPQIPGRTHPSGALGQTQPAPQQAPGYVQGQQPVYQPQFGQPIPQPQPGQPVQAPQQCQYPPNHGQPGSPNAAAYQQRYAGPGQTGKPPMTPLQTSAQVQQVQGAAQSNSPASVHTQHERPPSIISVMSTASSHGQASTAQSASPQRVQSMPQQGQMPPGIPPQGAPPQQYQPQMYPQMPGAQQQAQMQPGAAPSQPGQYNQAAQPNPGLPTVYSLQNYPQKPPSQQAGSTTSLGLTGTGPTTPQLHAGSIPSAQPAKKAWYKGWKRSGLKWTATVGAGAVAADLVGAEASDGMTLAEGMYDARKEQNNMKQSEQENPSKLLGQPQPPSQPFGSQAGQQQQQQQSQQGVIAQSAQQYPPQQQPGQQPSSQQSFGQQPSQQYPPQSPGQYPPQQQFGVHLAHQYNQQQQVPKPVVQSAPPQMQGLPGLSVPSQYPPGHGPPQIHNTMPAPAQPDAPQWQIPQQQYQNQQPSPMVRGQPGQYTNSHVLQQPPAQAPPGMPSQHDNDLRPSGNYGTPTVNSQLLSQQQSYQPVNYGSAPAVPMQQQQPNNPASSTQHAVPVLSKYPPQDQSQSVAPQGLPPTVQGGPQPGYQQPRPAGPSSTAPSATGISQLPSQNQPSVPAPSTGTASGNQAAGGKGSWGTGNYSGDGWGDNGW
ncbi:uncharacterized protein E0L32_006199 [Thyridium curvatum]|uniref:WW domain-containing protein n=1 Tax=Thyridium curvatum TaxID=1093900 RepID=A0A507B7T6_9PEZI|nr:uncharacterized protein E0L32_006199 [Thyridium curvatum]TPX13469.1 hypothetical protein E0L32_006199 [Thyridium curvatum]